MQPRLASYLAVLMSGGVLAGEAFSQTPLWRSEVATPVPALSPAGDVDGDGAADCLVGESSAATGRARVLSGEDGRCLFEFSSSAPSDFGWSVAGGSDMDGDGTADFLVGAPAEAGGAGAHYLYSGQDGGQWLHVMGAAGESHGRSLALLGDVDGDGDGEYVVGASAVDSVLHRGAGALRFYSGLDVVPYREHIGDGIDVGLGWSLCSVTDATGDGVLEVAAAVGGAPGRVLLFDGADGSLVHEWAGLTASPFQSYALADGGDLDGDGRGDLLLGFPFDASSGPNAGAVLAVSGRTGSVVFTISGAPGEGLGRGLSGAEDRDGDGVRDLLLGAPFAGTSGGPEAGVIRVHSGASQRLLYELRGDVPGQRLGYRVAGISDADLDGRGDHLALSSGLVEIQLFSGSCRAPVPYCVSSPNSTGAGAWMGAGGDLGLGTNDFSLVVDGAVPGGRGVFLYGAEADLQPFGEGYLCLDDTGVLRASPPLEVDGLGRARWRLDFTAAPFASGPGEITPASTWYFQFWYRDHGSSAPFPFNTSNGLRVTFCP